MVAEVSSYKGHRVLTLLFPKDPKTQIQRRFSFGLKKAQLILDNLDDIRVFVETGESAAK
jgi:hypothetical protein